MEKYSKVYILSFLFDSLRCRRHFCELSVCELHTSACLSVEWSKQLSSVLSKDHAFIHHSEFGATVPKMSLNFGIYIKRRHFNFFFLISQSGIYRIMASSACQQTPTGTRPHALNSLICPAHNLTLRYYWFCFSFFF